MEAVAVFSFRAKERDELSFQKGEILKVTEMDEDPNWMMAELHGRRGYVPENYISLLPHPWFAGRVSRQQAEQRLRWEERGVFLVRESESSPGEFSVSVSYGDMVEHFLVLEGLGQYCVWEETFSSLNRLVDFYRSHSIAQERPVYLTDPPDTPLHTHTPSHTPLHTHTPAHPLTHTAMHLPDPNPNPYTPLTLAHTNTPNPYLAEHHTHPTHPRTHTPNPNTHTTHSPNTHHTHTPTQHHPAPASYSNRREPSRNLNWGYSAPT
ncbi:GRB2-related adapter protein-like [Oncorhynchus clarkii lewisi]|uniref:GRB2 related adaptor protein b n=1 Tax=Oncorhynchus mykiss TaxID=8022 RepID=A0A8L0DRI6_ONCMY